MKDRILSTAQSSNQMQTSIQGLGVFTGGVQGLIGGSCLGLQCGSYDFVPRGLAQNTQSLGFQIAQTRSYLQTLGPKPISCLLDGCRKLAMHFVTKSFNLTELSHICALSKTGGL